MPKRTHLQPKRFLVAERSGAHRHSSRASGRQRFALRPIQIPSTSFSGAVSNGCDSDTEPDTLAPSAPYLNSCPRQGRRRVIVVGGLARAPWMPGLIWVRDPVGVGDVMVGGSAGWSDSGRARSLLGRRPGAGAAALAGAGRKRGRHRGWRRETALAWSWSARWDGFQGGGAAFAQHVEGAARELARDCQRRARGAESAGLERKVVGVVGAAGPTCGERGLIRGRG